MKKETKSLVIKAVAAVVIFLLAWWVMSFVVTIIDHSLVQAVISAVATYFVMDLAIKAGIFNTKPAPKGKKK